jgi:microcystin degradation protein MlrC
MAKVVVGKNGEIFDATEGDVAGLTTFLEDAGVDEGVIDEVTAWIDDPDAVQMTWHIG